MVTSGFRRGELAGLREGDIDLEHGRVAPSVPRVVVAGKAEDSDAKTRSGERWLALDPTTWAALQKYVDDWSIERELLGQDTQLLFVWPNGKPIHPDTITDLFHKHCATAGLPRIRLHDYADVLSGVARPLSVKDDKRSISASACRSRRSYLRFVRCGA